jgi:hypothetical protein
MAVRGMGIAATDGIQIVNSDVVGFASGGTLDSSNVVQINFDDTVFVGQEGKQRLLAAIELIEHRIATTASWPIGTTS